MTTMTVACLRTAALYDYQAFLLEIAMQLNTCLTDTCLEIITVVNLHVTTASSEPAVVCADTHDVTVMTV